MSSLLSPQLRKKLPLPSEDPLAAPGETLVFARFFDPTSSWRWYALEFDGQETFFGLIVTSHHAVAGNFTLSELESLRCPHPEKGEMKIERDLSFQGMTLRQLTRLEPNLESLFKSSGLDLIGLKEN